jgi:hypothetical protein
MATYVMSAMQVPRHSAKMALHYMPLELIAELPEIMRQLKLHE